MLGTPLPTDLDLSFYAAWRRSRGDRPGTIRSHLSAIAWFYKIHVGVDPTKGEDGLSAPLLKRVLKGIARLHTGKTKVRKPITVPLFKKIAAKFASANPDLSNYDVQAYLTFMSTGIWALLRYSEQGAPRVKGFDPEVHLRRQDVEFEYDHRGFLLSAVLTIKAGKTDVLRQTQRLTLHAIGGQWCPAQRLLDWTNMRRGPVGEPLYKLDDGSYITAARLTNRMRRTLAALGLKGQDWSTHSLRAGGACSLAACSNMSSELLSICGRWSSDCKELYLRHFPASVLREAHRKLARLGDDDIKTQHHATFQARFE